MYQNRGQRSRIAQREAIVQKRAASASPRRPRGILPEARMLQVALEAGGETGPQ
jgi:hypothetical protein